jgi:RNA polymerase sigma-54 factor
LLEAARRGGSYDPHACHCVYCASCVVMKQGLSLRVSQHLALTPQLQQSIRLLQLSTLELSQEVEQMLDDNPFLEREQTESSYEEELQSARDLEEASARAQAQEPDGQDASAIDSIAAHAQEQRATASNDAENSETNIPASDDAGPSDWDGDGGTELSPDDNEWGGDAPARNSSSANSGDDDTDATTLAAEHESLQAHLHRQALALRLSDVDRAALMFLIESLNDDGYLEDSLEELALSISDGTLEETEDLIQRFGVVRRLLQQMEPPGVGASGLAECLRLQLLVKAQVASRSTAQAQPTDESDAITTALAVCAQPLDLLARRDIKRLVQVCNTDAESIKAAIALIARLDPKPGRRFAEVERNIITPDVIVTASGRGTQIKFVVRLNNAVMPRLKVHDIYANALKGQKNDSSAGLHQRLTEARWFIKNIQQRFDTILRVSNAIVERQRNFFVHGALAMRPLVLREIADELGLHESTISRVTTAKYMSTPYGTFELKYFFGSGLNTETGGNASSTAVRALIQQFIDAEDRKKPLSDNAIADMLKEQGIECARRTVAKYREALRIAPTNLRKTL